MAISIIHGRIKRPTLSGEKVLFKSERIQLTAGSEEIGSYSYFETPELVGIISGDIIPVLSAKQMLERFDRGVADFMAATHGRYIAIVYDKRKDELSAFTDTSGFAHLYYSVTPDGLCLSTSVNKVLAYRGSMDIERRGLELYLTMQYVPRPYTMFSGVFALSIATALVNSSTHLSFTVASKPAAVEPSKNPARDIKALLVESMRRQLPSDARIGAFLSGGIDTSTNTALMAGDLGLSPTVFTAGFTEAEYDETPYARIMAEHYRLDHKVMSMEGAAIPMVDEIAALYDNPIADRAVLPEYIICQAANKLGLTHMVSGEGGDEVMGYPRNIAEDKPFPLDSNADAYSMARYYQGLTTLVPSALRVELMGGLALEQNYLARMYERQSTATPFERIYYGQWQTWLVEGVQMKDTVVMKAAGLKLVTPYMDRPLMDFMASLPLDTKLSGLKYKALVKEAMGEMLPEAIINKPKHKFYVPMTEWFRAGAYSYLNDNLTASDGFCAAYMDMAVVKRLLHEHRTEKADHNRELWSLLFVSRWYANKKTQLAEELAAAVTS